MKRRVITFLVVGVLAIGSVSWFAFANADIFRNDVKSITENEKEEKNFSKDMIKIMKENGYKDVAKAMEKDDYKSVDEFMNNMTDEDYENMIGIMKVNGYGTMAKMMESISREEMIDMHNSMGGAENCH